MTAPAVERYPTALLAAAMAMTLSACGGDALSGSAGGRQSDAVGVQLQTATPSYSRGDVPKLSMILRNNGSRECSLPSAAIGAVEVMSVQRDGVTLIGTSARVYLYDGVAGAVAGSLRPVAPGDSTTVPLDIERTPNGMPQVVSISEESGGARTTSWALDQPGSYRIVAVLVVCPVIS